MYLYFFHRFFSQIFFTDFFHRFFHWFFHWFFSPIFFTNFFHQFFHQFFSPIFFTNFFHRFFHWFFHQFFHWFFSPIFFTDFCHRFFCLSPVFFTKMSLSEELDTLKYSLDQRLHSPFFCTYIWVKSESNRICLSKIWVIKGTKCAYSRQKRIFMTSEVFD